MADARLAKARDTLPAGYQFGDAGKSAIRMRYIDQFNISIDQHPVRIYFGGPHNWRIEAVKDDA